MYGKTQTDLQSKEPTVRQSKVENRKFNTFSHWKTIFFTARLKWMSFITEHFHDAVIVIRILLDLLLKLKKN